MSVWESLNSSFWNNKDKRFLRILLTPHPFYEQLQRTEDEAEEGKRSVCLSNM